MERYTMLIERFNIAKMAIPAKWIYVFNAIPIRTAAGFWVEIGRLILTFACKCKGPRITTAILKRTKLENLFYLISRFTKKAM